MRARLRGNRLASIMVVLVAGAGLGCDWFPGKDGRGLPPWSRTPPTAQPDAAPTATHDAGSAPDADGIGNAYDAMCLHYCKSLEQTQVLVCAASGRDAAACATTSSTTATCVDLRCTPRLVDLPLCLKQCDSLARFYNEWCPVTGGASDPLCPSSQADHDAACRAGCVL